MLCSDDLILGAPISLCRMPTQYHSLSDGVCVQADLSYSYWAAGQKSTTTVQGKVMINGLHGHCLLDALHIIHLTHLARKARGCCGDIDSYARSFQRRS